MLHPRGPVCYRIKSSVSVLLSDSGVQVADEAVDVDAVGQSALLDVLDVSGSAAQAAHAGIPEDLSRVRVLLYDLEYAHIFSYSHFINLLIKTAWPARPALISKEL